MRFVPYEQLNSLPNVIVDGAANPSTVLTLSHWPKSSTPAALKRDTSAEIVFAYLDSPDFHVHCDIVSNNHFDEDGLVGIFTLIEPSTAGTYRNLLIDIASAGDFGVYERRDAARIAFTIAAYADSHSSPLPKSVFEMPYPEMAAHLYSQLLEIFPLLLTNLPHYRELWRDEDERLTASEQLIEEGDITIEERRDLDLAVAYLPEALSRMAIHRFAQRQLAECHPFALHNRTECSRLLAIRGQHVEFQYRYESWVQLVSRRPPSRVDLTDLAVELNRDETSGGRWTFDGVDRITPKLCLKGSPATSLSPNTVLRRLEHHLSTGPPAWDPYD